MDLSQFHTLRTAVQLNAAPGTVAELRSFERRLRRLLVRSGMFEEVEVGHTDDRHRLVIALCRIRPMVSEREVADRVEALWSDQLRYPFWEAHTMLTDEGHVELEGASRVSPVGHYVTVHLVAQAARIPAQREEPTGTRFQAPV